MSKARIWAGVGLIVLLGSAVGWWVGRGQPVSAPSTTVGIHSLTCQPQSSGGAHRLRVVAENSTANRFTGVTVRFYFGEPGLEQTLERSVSTWDPRAFLDLALTATTDQPNPACRVAFFRSNGQIEIPSTLLR